MEVRVERRVLRFARPLRTAYGELRDRVLLELTIRGADGVEGRGEAAPLEPYDGVPLAAVAEAVDAYAAAVAAAPAGYTPPPVTSVSVTSTVSGGS
jgi:hypothetical protein